jgi:hypothetical protein
MNPTDVISDVITGIIFDILTSIPSDEDFILLEGWGVMLFEDNSKVKLESA